MIVFGIRDAEAAAQIQFGQRNAGFLPDLRHKIEHHFRRMDERLLVEDLRTDVAVQAAQGNPFGSGRRLHRAQRVPVLQRKAEFRVDLSGADEGVGMRLHAGVTRR